MQVKQMPRCWPPYLPYMYVPHSVVEFCIASKVNTGISSPEKNATRSVRPVT